MVLGFFGYLLWQCMQKTVSWVLDLVGASGGVARYADACVEGLVERCKRALDFSQFSNVAARAAGSVNLAVGVAARRLLMGRLKRPLLGMPVSMRKQ